MEYIDIINELNDEIHEKHGEVEYHFYYSTNGFVDVIGFGDIMLWNSENDEREFDEDKNDYEPLKPYIKKLFNEFIDKLYSLKF